MAPKVNINGKLVEMTPRVHYAPYKATDEEKRKAARVMLETIDSMLEKERDKAG